MIYAARAPRRSLAEVIDCIELVAKNHALPRDQIVTLCAEARRSTDYKWETANPIKAKVIEAAQRLVADNDGIARMPSEKDGELGPYMRVTDLCGLAKLDPNAANLNRVARCLSDLGYVRLLRTRIYSSCRWFMPVPLR